MYVDHFLSGAESEKESIKRSDDLEIVFKWDGFKLTTVTFSQKYSLETLTDDGGEHKRSWDPVVSQGSQECSKYWWAQFYKNDSKKKAYAKLQISERLHKWIVFPKQLKYLIFLARLCQ